MNTVLKTEIIKLLADIIRSSNVEDVMLKIRAKEIMKKIYAKK